LLMSCGHCQNIENYSSSDKNYSSPKRIFKQSISFIGCLSLLAETFVRKSPPFVS